MKHERLYRVMSGDARDPWARLLRGATRLAEPLYTAAVKRRNAAFDDGRRTPADLGRPTLSVGNLTTGGTGKTPMVADLTQRLLDAGHRPAILLRGHAAHETTAGNTQNQNGPPAPRHVSDESLLHQQTFGDRVPVAADPDRVRSARYVLHHHPQTSCFVLDDAFQHRQVRRDLDLVLIDATRPFGFGHVLPRGLLREPVEGLQRADAVVVTRADRVPPEALQAIDERIQDLTGRPPLAHAAHAWDGFDVYPKDAEFDPATLTVMAFTGLGNPDDFEASLRQHVGAVADHQRLDDHAEYDPALVNTALENAVANGIDAVVTSGKDFVKWAPHLPDPLTTPILVPRLKMDWLDGPDALATLLAERLPPPAK